MPDAGVRLETKGPIAIITIDRPERKNVFNEAMWSSLESVSRQLKEKLPRVIVLTGSGNKTFCAGFDVNPDNPQVAGLIDAIEQQDLPPVSALLKRIRSAVDSLVNLPVPLIAAINGEAFGGGAELAVRCDLRVMDPGAVICFSEVTLGLMPDWGGGVTLTRLIGSSRAADLILTARKIDAKEALELGMINRISREGKAFDEAMRLAETISGNGPRAVRSALEVIRKAADLPMSDALDLETRIGADLVVSGECIHGITAFLSKQTPDFPDPSDKEG